MSEKINGWQIVIADTVYIVIVPFILFIKEFKFVFKISLCGSHFANSDSVSYGVGSSALYGTFIQSQSFFTMSGLEFCENDTEFFLVFGVFKII